MCARIYTTCIHSYIHYIHTCTHVYTWLQVPDDYVRWLYREGVHKEDWEIFAKTHPHLAQPEGTDE